MLNAFPGEFYSRYTLISFSLAPYRFAQQLGEIAGGIVRELAQGLGTQADADRVDLTHAKALIDARLAPFLKENDDGFRPQG